MNFPTAAGEVETHKFQLSIVYHLLLFSVGVRRLPRSRFLASAMLSKDSTRTELGKRPIPTRRVGHNLNTITYRRSLLSRQPNSHHRGNRKDKREDNLVSHSLLLFGYSGNNQVTSSPGWDRHRTTRPGPRCVPPFFLFHYPLIWLSLIDSVCSRSLPPYCPCSCTTIPAFAGKMISHPAGVANFPKRGAPLLPVAECMAQTTELAFLATSLVIVHCPRSTLLPNRS